jgi:hypothetical protein
MNVRELIELLKQENPETEVVLTADNFEQGYPRKLAGGLFNFRGKIVRKPSEMHLTEKDMILL